MAVIFFCHVCIKIALPVSVLTFPTPADLYLHFPYLHFPPLQFVLRFSILAYSIPRYLPFPYLHFQSPPNNNIFCKLSTTGINDRLKQWQQQDQLHWHITNKIPELETTLTTILTWILRYLLKTTVNIFKWLTCTRELLITESKFKFFTAKKTLKLSKKGVIFRRICLRTVYNVQEIQWSVAVESDTIDVRKKVIIGDM